MNVNEYGSNLLANPSAESGVGSWTTSEVVQNSETSTDGTYCFRIATMGYMQQTILAPTRIPQDFLLEIDFRYTNELLATDSVMTKYVTVIFTYSDATRDVVTVPLEYALNLTDRVVTVYDNRNWYRVQEICSFDSNKTLVGITVRINNKASAALRVDRIYLKPHAGLLSPDLSIVPTQINTETTKIKVTQIDALEVGSNVAMGPNAYISWGNVQNKPSIPSTNDISSIALDTIQDTYIDAYGVWTPNVYAKNISTLTGKITTAQIETLTVGGNVVMGPNATISWSNVQSKPTIPTTAAEVGARPYDWVPSYGDITGTKPPTNADNTYGTIGSNRLTHIDSSGIYTGTLTAQQINAVQGITLGANATIQWANLPSLPTASQVGARPSTWVPNKTDLGSWTTYIDSNGIYTGVLNANQVNAGTLTGFTIQTAGSGYRTVMKQAGAYPDYSFAGFNSGGAYHGLVIIPSVADLVIYEGGNEAFRVYMADPVTQVVKLKGYTDDILGYNNYLGKTYALGTWSFSSCIVEGLQVKFG